MKTKSYKLFLATIAILLLSISSPPPSPPIKLPKDHWAFSIPRNVTSLITYHGYNFEEHEVITSDGYILKIHRIPSNNTKLIVGFSFNFMIQLEDRHLNHLCMALGALTH